MLRSARAAHEDRRSIYVDSNVDQHTTLARMTAQNDERSTV
jgi:hypothetical protein